MGLSCNGSRGIGRRISILWLLANRRSCVGECRCGRAVYLAIVAYQRTLMNENPYSAPQEKPPAEPDYASMTTIHRSTIGLYLFWVGVAVWLWSFLYMIAHSMDAIGPQGFVRNILWPAAFFGSPIAIILGIILRISGRRKTR